MRTSAIILVALLGLTSAQYLEENRNIINFVTSRVYEDRINATIENLKVTLNAGDPANGIPSFNPLELSNLTVFINESDIIKTNMTLNNVVGNGLTDFVATYIKFNVMGFKMDINLTFNHINLVGDYGGDAELFGFIPLYGAGTFDVDVTKLDITASFKLGTTGGNVSIDNLTIAVNIEESAFAFTGLLNDPDASTLLTAVINDIVPDFIHNRAAWLTVRISEIVSGIANSMVEGMTVQDLLDILYGETTLAPEVTSSLPMFL